MLIASICLWLAGCGGVFEGTSAALAPPASAATSGSISTLDASAVEMSAAGAAIAPGVAAKAERGPTEATTPADAVPAPSASLVHPVEPVSVEPIPAITAPTAAATGSTASVASNLVAPTGDRAAATSDVVNAETPATHTGVDANTVLAQLPVAPPASGSGRTAAAPTSATPQAAPATQPAASSDHRLPGYTLAFAEEFNGTGLDRSKWCTRYVYHGKAPLQVPDAACQRFGGGTLDWLNDEQQRYVDFNTQGEPMHVVSAGVLTLRATRTRADAYAAYESAMIRSKALFRPSAAKSYYITARVRLPNVRGTWPAFWLNSDWNDDGTIAWPPEIDILEAALNEKWDTASMVMMLAQPQNWGGERTGKNRQYTYAAPDFDTDKGALRTKRNLREVWIEAGAEWTEKTVCFFLDGYKTACQAYEWKANNGSLAAPAHILLNLGIGGAWAGAFGIDDAKFPTSMQADHIRVYEKSLR
jgi:beta-glucanase (GH16 family)